MPTGPEDPSPGAAPARVAATRADRHDVRKLARRERLAGALWPVPSLFGLAALVAAVATVALDDSFGFHVADNRFLVGDSGTALTLTSVVATGMLAFLGIVFATTLVAIQLAASQYSPRAVRVFVRSRLTKVSFGIFVATFVYSIVTLIAIRSAHGRDRGFTPVLSTTGVALLVIATIVAFLLFANGTARLLRVQYLVERIADETRPALTIAFPTGRDAVDVVRPPPSGTPVAIHARAHGVIDAVDVAGLAAVAARAGGWMEVTRPIGSYVGSGTTIAVVHPGRDALASDAPADVCDAVPAHERAQPAAGSRLRPAPARRHRDPGALPRRQRSHHRGPGGRPRRRPPAPGHRVSVADRVVRRRRRGRSGPPPRGLVRRADGARVH